MAIELIEAGSEELSVYRVAAEDKFYSRDHAETLVRKMFVSLGVTYPVPLESARQTMAQQIAREVMAGLRDPWKAAAKLDRVVPHWETRDENIWAIYAIKDEADEWYVRNVAALEPELMEAFGRLAL